MSVTKASLAREIIQLKEHLLIEQKKVRKSDRNFDKIAHLIACYNRTLQKINSSSEKEHVSIFCCMFRSIRMDAGVLLNDF